MFQDSYKMPRRIKNKLEFPPGSWGGGKDTVETLMFYTSIWKIFVLKNEVLRVPWQASG